MTEHFSSLAYAYGQPSATGSLKQSAADFIVTEQLSFTPSAEGEHLFLNIQKTNLNTLDVCEKIAQYFHVQSRNVAYAGLKDKNAITSQWFSFPCPIKSNPNLTGFESENISIVDSVRNAKKLKRGAIKSNHFEIILRDLQGDLPDIEKRISHIQTQGVPNYFGAQRFGRHENNLSNAVKLFSGSLKCSRNKKSLYLSAARSFIFNEIISKRVANKTWNTIIAGDVAVLNNSRSFFIIETIDNEIQQRLQQGDIHVSAPLWGKGEPLSQLAARELEEAVIKLNIEFSDGLVKEGLRQDRRAMRLHVSSLKYQLSEHTLSLSFSLPSGSYATSVLREILLINK